MEGVFNESLVVGRQTWIRSHKAMVAKTVLWDAGRDGLLVFYHTKFWCTKHVTLVKNSGARGRMGLEVMLRTFWFRTMRVGRRHPSFVNRKAVVGRDTFNESCRVGQRAEGARKTLLERREKQHPSAAQGEPDWSAGGIVNSYALERPGYQAPLCAMLEN